jgi:hypothetical protein
MPWKAQHRVSPVPITSRTVSASRAVARTILGAALSTASVAIQVVSRTLRVDIRLAEVVAQDIHLTEDGSITYRSRLFDLL